MKTQTNITVESPGRINLIGEHVDYNGGFVLPASINKKIIIEFNTLSGNECYIESKTVKKSFSLNLKKISKSKIIEMEIKKTGKLFSFCCAVPAIIKKKMIKK